MKLINYIFQSILALIVISGCTEETTTQVATATQVATVKQVATAKQIGLEYPPPDEIKAVQKLRQVLTKDQMIKPGPWRRGQHFPLHGCVSASFEVANDLPDIIKVGIFKEQRTFSAIVRFSNGQNDDDRKPDVHGIAIKLLDVAGEKILQKDEKHTQDFILADNTIFFARSVQHMLDFVLARDSGKPITEIIKTHPKLIGFTKPPPPSPLEGHYWSQTPYRLGKNAVRYSAVPAQQNISDEKVAESEHFLREALVKFLTKNNKEARFDFYVQLQTNPDTMNIEDSTVEWDEEASKPIKVATITIAPQKFDSPGQMALCETLSYTPWHSLPEHRPLGGINRARRHIYIDSSKLRHKTYEPTGEEQPRK